MSAESVAKYWKDFCAHAGVDVSEPFQSWYFGDSRELADKLNKLVLDGTKRATACLKDPDDDPTRPVDGQYCVVTDFDGEPKFVIRLTEVRHMPFNEVDAAFAFDEGEGDRSLDYWRQAHWDFFSRCPDEVNGELSPTMMVTCQRFELLFPADAASQPE